MSNQIEMNRKIDLSACVESIISPIQHALAVA